MESLGRGAGQGGAGGQGGELRTWRPEKQLRVLTQEEARYSRGFLAAQPVGWFGHLAELWLPLFHSLSADIALRGFEKGFDVPTSLHRNTVFHIDGEPALLAMDKDTYEIIAREVVPGCSGIAAGVAVEYVERRLLATFDKSWLGSEPLRCQYLSYQQGLEVDVAGVFAVMLDISGLPATLWFGLGSRTLGRLDAEWRMKLFQQQRARGKNPLADQIHTASVELVELAVPPAMLIDYMRSGTVIDLEIPVSDKVQVRLDEELWLEGQLCQFNGSFAVEVQQTRVTPKTLPEATTRVRIEIAGTELDEEGVIEHAQEGAVLLSDSPLSSRASLVISGEKVADAVVGELNGNFALQILPK